METPGENFEAPQNPTGGSEEENTSGNQFQGLLKNLLLILVLIALIIACFWVSFLLGKRILTPPKRPVPINLTLPTSEALPTSDHLQKLAIEATREATQEVGNVPMTMEAIAKVKKAVIKKVKPVKVVKKMPPTQIAGKAVKPLKKAQKLKTAVAKKFKKPAARKATAKKVKKYYKVQVGFFKNSASANAMAGKIQAAGFKSFIKYLPSGMRVQVGAFRTRTEANKARANLKAHGFQSLVIYE